MFGLIGRAKGIFAYLLASTFPLLLSLQDIGSGVTAGDCSISLEAGKVEATDGQPVLFSEPDRFIRVQGVFLLTTDCDARKFLLRADSPTLFDTQRNQIFSLYRHIDKGVLRTSELTPADPHPRGLFEGYSLSPIDERLGAEISVGTPGYQSPPMVIVRGRRDSVFTRDGRIFVQLEEGGESTPVVTLLRLTRFHGIDSYAIVIARERTLRSYALSVSGY